MDIELKKYYIPNNIKNIKGRIYALYINNNNNLDLSILLNTKNIKIPSQNSNLQKSIIISEKDYTRLLELNNIAYQLITKRNTDIQEFINNENKNITELTQINAERQELVKKLMQGRE